MGCLWFAVVSVIDMVLGVRIHRAAGHNVLPDVIHPTDELLPVFLPLRRSDWPERAFHRLRLPRQPADSHRTAHHLPVHLLALQRGKVTHTAHCKVAKEQD